MTSARGWGRSALLMALAATGQAASLRLTDAPSYAVYQHFLDWDAALARAPLALLVLAVQAAVVLALVWPRRGALIAGVLRIARGWTLALLVLAIGFAAVVPTASAGRTLREIVLSLTVAALAGLTLALAVAEAPAEGLSGAATWLGSRLTLHDDPAEPRPWDRRFPWLAAFWVVGATALISVWVFERVPHIDDGVAYLFQAKYFAAGHLWLPQPPDSAAFHVDQVVVSGGKWFGYGFPGWPTILAIGVAAGVPWLVNPVLAGMSILLAHSLVRRLGGLAAAHAVCALLCVSPWLLFTSAEFMGHPFATVLALSALLALERARERRGAARGAVLGAAMGMLALTRPLDAAIVGVLVGVRGLGVGGRRLSAGSIAVALATAGVLAALILPYNAALTGRATYAPHEMWSDRAWGTGVDRLGFGADVGIPAWPNLDPLPGHGAPDVVLNLNKNLFGADRDLLGWACGSLVFVWLAVLGAGRRGDGTLAIGLVAGFAAGYSLYWFNGGPDFTPRYWFPALVAFVILTVRGAQSAAERLDAGDFSRPSGPRVAAFVAAASLCAVATFLPWRATTKYYRYRAVSGTVRELARTHGFGRALVLVRSRDREDYQSAFTLNPASLDGDAPVYARDVGPAHTAAVVRHFADRPVWVIEHIPGTPGRLAVTAGPLPPGTFPP